MEDAPGSAAGSRPAPQEPLLNYQDLAAFLKAITPAQLNTLQEHIDDEGLSFNFASVQELWSMLHQAVALGKIPVSGSNGGSEPSPPVGADGDDDGDESGGSTEGGEQRAAARSGDKRPQEPKLAPAQPPGTSSAAGPSGWAAAAATVARPRVPAPNGSGRPALGEGDVLAGLHVLAHAAALSQDRPDRQGAPSPAGASHAPVVTRVVRAPNGVAPATAEAVVAQQQQQQPGAAGPAASAQPVLTPAVTTKLRTKRPAPQRPAGGAAQPASSGGTGTGSGPAGSGGDDDDDDSDDDEATEGEMDMPPGAPKGTAVAGGVHVEQPPPGGSPPPPAAGLTAAAAAAIAAVRVGGLRMPEVGHLMSDRLAERARTHHGGADMDAAADAAARAWATAATQPATASLSSGPSGGGAASGAATPKQRRSKKRPADDEAGEGQASCMLRGWSVGRLIGWVFNWLVRWGWVGMGSMRVRDRGRGRLSASAARACCTAHHSGTLACTPQHTTQLWPWLHAVVMYCLLWCAGGGAAAVAGPCKGAQELWQCEAHL